MRILCKIRFFKPINVKFYFLKFHSTSSISPFTDKSLTWTDKDETLKSFYFKMLRSILVAAVILVISFADINAETPNSPTGDNPSDTNVIHPPEELPPHISSFLPNPNGPFYGFPFDTKTTWSRMLPFTVSGHCEVLKYLNIWLTICLIIFFKKRQEKYTP